MARAEYEAWVRRIRASDHPDNTEDAVFRAGMEAGASRTEALEREVASLKEIQGEFSVAARSYHNIAQHGGPPYDFDGCQQQVCIYWRSLIQAASPRAGDGGAEGAGG